VTRGATDPPGPPPVAFRVAGVADAETLLGLMREFYALEHMAWDPERARAAMVGLLADPARGRVWIAEAPGPGGERAAGYCVMTLGYSLEFHGPDALLDELYLREAYRGQGLGTSAIALVEAEARARGVPAVHLEVERVNTRAQAVYRRLGYRDHDRYLMTHWLDGPPEPGPAP
jgi:ribosomal protein S18 acetylase RimI-like enzyme